MSKCNILFRWWQQVGETEGSDRDNQFKMTKANVINGGIEYIPRKTKDGRPVTVRVPLNSIAKEILERYKDCPFDELLPLISQQKYNVAIKKMFLAAGLIRPVVVYNSTTSEQEIRPLDEVASSHLARRCFVGNLYKQVKDPTWSAPSAATKKAAAPSPATAKSTKI